MAVTTRRYSLIRQFISATTVFINMINEAATLSVIIYHPGLAENIAPDGAQEVMSLLKVFSPETIAVCKMVLFTL